MEYQPAIAMNFGNQFRHRTQRSDDQRHLVFDTERQLFLYDPVCAVDNQIDPKGRRCRPVSAAICRGPHGWSPAIPQPVQRALVLCRKGADDAGAAGRANPGPMPEHWRRHNRQRQAIFKGGRKGHVISSSRARYRSDMSGLASQSVRHIIIAILSAAIAQKA